MIIPNAIIPPNVNMMMVKRSNKRLCSHYEPSGPCKIKGVMRGEDRLLWDKKPW